ncbi:efflux RND transporter permease subunit [Methyloligella sp. 2.7D]|uniref:efflux RND transporter permease subunit n=1 Tax=unclassified Methyloligella TaxID=2625955 RepID=UPI00157DB5F1|nr:efflux RND transporter permease subunit [Methyloligella sp. GL2]QKP78397.1 efflux RND transporter permease subunit [Methyloligella sp. GL2]
MNGISAWAIKKPVPTIVLFLVLTLFGALSFDRLRINTNPDIDVPTVTVNVSWSGAAPTEMETQVTRLVENAVAGLSNIDHINSTVTEGSSDTEVRFLLGTDIDRATDDVRNAISSIRSNLPSDVLEPTVERVDATDRPILTYVIDAPDMTPDEVSWFVDNDISKAVLGSDGVSKLTRSGGVDREIRIRLDPDRLMALGVTAAEISDVLDQQNVNQPGGRTTLGQGEQAIRTLGSVSSVEQLAATRIPLDDGRTVKLSDLGVVENSWAEPRQRARLNGKEVVAFSIYRSVGTSEVDVADAVRTRLKAFDAAHPDITLSEVTSSTDWVLEGYDAALEALWLGALLAVVVVWLFLRDIRATLISSVALPLSLLPTFAVMYLLNQSLNNITLLGIALVVGILVDDAIVEIENIVRHMRTSGKSAYESAIEAADEIGLAVVATTFSIIAVFMPVAFMPGIPGQFFKAFAIAVCCSVFFSLVVARLLTPMMGAYLMRTGGKEEDEAFWVPAYLKLLGVALRFRWLTVLGGIAFFIGSIYLASLLPTDFMPASDRGRSILSVELAPGATLDETDATAQQAAAILAKRPEVASVYTAIGSEREGGAPGSNTAGEVRTATVTVNLKPRDERDLSQQEFEAEMGPELAKIPGARMRFGADGRSGAKVTVTLTSDDGNALSQAVNGLLRDMRTLPGLQNIGSTSALARPELLITPKADKAAALGVTTSDIAETANIATLGDADQNLPKFNLKDRQINIRVMLKDDARSNLARIETLRVPATNGSVPLSSVADLSLGSGPNQIDRVDRRRSATIEAELIGTTIGEANEMIGALPTMQNLPDSVTRVAAGDTERMQELFSGFQLAIISGVVLLYFVMVLLFQGFVQPVTILTALPLAIGGAMAFLLITGSSLSMSVLIGVLMLMGIAAKNSILLVEYAILARKDWGMSRHDALIDAARKRARPIVMTTVAMGAGMLPIAIGLGADAEFRAPMAIAVIGGLLSSTALSLIYVPAIFTVMDDLQTWLGRMLRWTVTLPEIDTAPVAKH